MPDGSRHRTSPRSDSAIRSVGRSRIDGASTGTLSSERRSPNWRLPSISTVRCSSWPRATARLKAIVVLPTPPFGAKTLMTRVLVKASSASKSLRAWAIRVIRSKPENGIDRTPWMPVLASGSIGVCGHGQDDDRHAELGVVDHLDELEALDPALEQRVDEDDVGPHLLDRGERPAAVGQDLEELDPLLRVEQTADVLGDLRDILDDEQARLVTRWHRPDDTTRVGAGTRPGCPPPELAHRTGRRAGSGLDREEDRPLAAGAHRTQVVAARQELDGQPGVLGVPTQLVGRDEAQPVAADPAAGRLALAALLEDRGQGDARRWRRRAGPRRPW